MIPFTAIAIKQENFEWPPTPSPFEPPSPEPSSGEDELVQVNVETITIEAAEALETGTSAQPETNTPVATELNERQLKEVGHTKAQCPHLELQRVRITDKKMHILEPYKQSKKTEQKIWKALTVRAIPVTNSFLYRCATWPISELKADALQCISIVINNDPTLKGWYDISMMFTQVGILTWFRGISGIFTTSQDKNFCQCFFGRIHVLFCREGMGGDDQTATIL